MSFIKQHMKDKLPEEFPVEKLREMNFGNPDGHRDKIINDAFILTSSVRKFLQNNHSLIVGPIGSGKSTLYRYIKEKHRKLKNFKNSLIIPIEESVSFKDLKTLVTSQLSNLEDEIVYAIVWKLQFAIKLGDEIAKIRGFPDSKDEKELNSFLIELNSVGYKSTALEALKRIIKELPIKITAKASSAEVTVSGNSYIKGSAREFNLDRILKLCSDISRDRIGREPLFIIDKIDKFVIGEDYETQRNYIKALLDIEDDLSISTDLKFKIFLRSDLFERIDLSSLGYDKVRGNTIRLEWNEEEIIRFVAKRVGVALINAEILSEGDLLLSTNLENYHLEGLDFIRLHPKTPKWIKKLIIKGKDIDSERRLSLFGKLDRAIITKVFPRRISHVRNDNEISEISIIEFFQTHFRDGQGVCTPRYLLIFLSQVQDKVAEYYETNPDQPATRVIIDGDIEWKVFREGCVYSAYDAVKYEYERNIEDVDFRWKKRFVEFINKKGNKTKFEYKWIRANLTDIDEGESCDFLAFMQTVGYLKIESYSDDIRKRKFELPILYLRANVMPYPVSEKAQ